VLNPTHEELELSDIDLFVAGSENAIIMVEGSAKEVKEEEMLEAILFGHQSLKPVINLQKQLRKAAGLTTKEFEIERPGEDLKEKVKAIAQEKLLEAFQMTEKTERRDRLEEILQMTYQALEATDENSQRMIKTVFEETNRNLVRKLILHRKQRIDGRGLAEIRPISCEVGILPRTHGSALFTRGETQVLAVVTFGTSEDEQKINSLSGETYKSFMLHYNFPPFSVERSHPPITQPKRDRTWRPG
jgi:polyribonucleotide nucleotidyltransferase